MATTDKVIGGMAIVIATLLVVVYLQWHGNTPLNNDSLLAEQYKRATIERDSFAGLFKVQLDSCRYFRIRMNTVLVPIKPTYHAPHLDISVGGDSLKGVLSNLLDTTNNH